MQELEWEEQTITRNGGFGGEGVMKLFYIYIVVAFLQLYIFIKAYRIVH